MSDSNSSDPTTRNHTQNGYGNSQPPSSDETNLVSHNPAELHANSLRANPTALRVANLADIPRDPRRQTVFGVRMPLLYEVWRDGLYRQKAPMTDDDTAAASALVGPATLDENCPGIWRKYVSRICAVPVWIKDKARALDGEVYYEVQSVQQARVHSQWELRRDLTQARRVTDLAGSSLPIGGDNSKSMASYFHVATSMNEDMPYRSVVRDYGYVPSDPVTLARGWLVPPIEASTRLTAPPSRWIGWGPPPALVPERVRAGKKSTLNVPLDVARVSSLAPREDCSSWWETFEKLCVLPDDPDPYLRWLTIASLATPVLQLLELPSLLVHHWSLQGQGKRALRRFGHQAWSPAPHSTSADDFIFAASLDLSNRETRRGALLGPSRVVRSIGAEPIEIRDAKDDDSRRVVQISKGSIPRGRAHSLHAELDVDARTHGAGFKILDALSAHCEPSAHHRLMQYSSRFRRQAVEELGRERTEPLSGQFTAVALAYLPALTQFYGVGPDAVTSIERFALEDMRAVITEHRVQIRCQQSPAMRGLQLIADSLVGSAQRWYSLANEGDANAVRENSTRSLLGVVPANGEEVWLVQSEINSILRKHKLEPNRVWRELAAEGWLVTPKGSGWGVRRSAGKFQATVYCLRMEAFGVNLFDFEAVLTSQKQQ